MTLLSLILLIGCRAGVPDVVKDGDTGGDGDSRDTVDSAVDSALDTGDSADTADSAPPDPVDADGDGAVEADDCNDHDTTVYPGAPERCDNLDNNCDGAIDEGVVPMWYPDADGDRYGTESGATAACVAPAGTVDVSGDCDDENALRHPGAYEGDCTDPTDYNCDGSVGYADADADGFPACEDCDDFAAAVNSAAVESCNTIDDDCDGSIDESGATGELTFYQDGDGDGFGDATDTILSCEMPAGYSSDNTDCDDRYADVFPGADEACNYRDDDCDGDLDEAGATDESTWYLDADGDGYGDATLSVVQCHQPSRYELDGADCDDGDAAIHPGATETCNDIDDDCSGDTDSDAVDRDAWYTDGDDDGFGDAASSTLDCDPIAGAIRNPDDCDDTDGTVHPYAGEDMTDLVDNDCDGGVDAADTDILNSVTLGDDQGTLITPASMHFPLCGNSYSSMYFQSNGRVTFGSSDDRYTETAAEFANDAAVAALFDDLDPRYYGPTLDWVDYGDAVGFYWRGITEYQATNSSTFSLVLLEDGRSILEYENIDVLDGGAGFSCSPGTATGEVDLTGEMASLAAGRWGYGDGTESMVYEVFDADDNDLDDTMIRLCGNADNRNDPCADE